MAFKHGKSARIYVNGYDLTSYFRSMKAGGGGQAVKVTTFGKDSEEYIPGLKDGKVSVEGLYDGSLFAVHQVMAAALAQDDKLWVVMPTGDGDGKPGFGIKGIQTKYDMDEPADDAVKLSAEVTSNVGIDYLVALHGLAIEMSSGNGAGQDKGASSLFGAHGYLQATDITGITELDVKIQHSADGSSWSDLMTFTGVTADFKAERLTVTGTVERHTRAVWTFTGTGSARFFVGLARNTA